MPTPAWCLCRVVKRVPRACKRAGRPARCCHTRLACIQALELCVQANGKHLDRSAVCVVARVADVLHAQADRTLLQERQAKVVIPFHNFFRPVIERPVTDEKTNAASSQECLV